MHYQTPIIVEPEQDADCAVIWLHGLGADGHDFAGLLPYLPLPLNHKIRFVFPHANSIPVTINGGYVMPAWYDIRSVAFDDRVIDEEFARSVAYVHQLIEQQQLPSQRILLAGFSQGGAIALHAGLDFATPLAGIMALSTYLVDDSVISPASPIHADMPIFVAHGTEDPVVPAHLGEHVAQHLQAKGYATQFHAYPMEHAVCEDEIAAIGQFVNHTLTP